MVYDDAWDMPKVNWVQQGSFVIPEIPPSTEPDAEPLVCLPAINQYWMPYVMGALDQLRNSSSWLVADDDAMYVTLARVSKLREMIGVRAVCMSYLIRFDGESCQLQQSTDGGTTWTEVDGWADFAACQPPQTQLQFTDGCELQESFNGGTAWEVVPGWVAHFGACVQDNVPIIGLPPNPGDQTPDQLACSIAEYLANNIILEGLQAATTAITDDLSLLAMADSILTIIPEFILVRAFVDGVSIVYTAVQEGTLSDFETALTDTTLWAEVTCAIYAAILADGYVTPGNCAAISANIHAIGYTPSDVQDAIDSYVSAIGCEGLAQLSQRAGLVVGATCVCGTGPWCSSWSVDFTDICNGEWTTPYPNGYALVTTCGGGVFHSASNLAGGEFTVVDAVLPDVRTITCVRVDYAGGFSDITSTEMYDDSDTLVFSTALVNWVDGDGPGPIANVKRIRIIRGSGDGEFTLNNIQVGGPDSGSPWGHTGGVCD